MWYLKFFIGIMGLIGIVILIAGPLLLFSTLNPIAVTNPIYNLNVQFNFEIQKTLNGAINTIPIYSNNFVSELENIPDSYYNALGLGNYLETKSFDKSLI